MKANNVKLSFITEWIISKNRWIFEWVYQVILHFLLWKLYIWILFKHKVNISYSSATLIKEHSGSRCYVTKIKQELKWENFIVMFLIWFPFSIIYLIC